MWMKKTCLLGATLPSADQMALVVCPHWKISWIEIGLSDPMWKEHNRMDSTYKKTFYQTSSVERVLVHTPANSQSWVSGDKWLTANSERGINPDMRCLHIWQEETLEGAQRWVPMKFENVATGSLGGQTSNKGQGLVRSMSAAGRTPSGHLRRHECLVFSLVASLHSAMAAAHAGCACARPQRTARLS